MHRDAENGDYRCHIAKYGNLILNMSGAELFEQGFEHVGLSTEEVAALKAKLGAAGN